MADDKRIDAATGTEIKHHEWDGIQELDTPLPRWWLWTFYATILFAIGYVIAYPALPMIDRATGGVLGWSSRGALDKELAVREQQIARFGGRSPTPHRRAADAAATDAGGGRGWARCVSRALRAVPWIGRGGVERLSQPE